MAGLAPPGQLAGMARCRSEFVPSDSAQFVLRIAKEGNPLMAKRTNRGTNSHGTLGAPPPTPEELAWMRGIVCELPVSLHDFAGWYLVMSVLRPGGSRRIGYGLQGGV
jgi:hypothetical protein